MCSCLVFLGCHLLQYLLLLLQHLLLLLLHNLLLVLFLLWLLLQLQFQLQFQLQVLFLASREQREQLSQTLSAASTTGLPILIALCQTFRRRTALNR